MRKVVWLQQKKQRHNGLCFAIWKWKYMHLQVFFYIISCLIRYNSHVSNLNFCYSMLVKATPCGILEQEDKTKYQY